MVYTTALFSDAHVVNLSQRGNEDDDEENEGVSKAVLRAAGMGICSADIMRDQYRGPRLKGILWSAVMNERNI